MLYTLDGKDSCGWDITHKKAPLSSGSKHFKGYEICEEYYATSHCIYRTCSIYCTRLMYHAERFRISFGINWKFVSIEIRQTFVPFYPFFNKNSMHLR
jgi:hypothetical protein